MADKDLTKVTIYALIDPFTGRVRYVGKTIDLTMRLKAHLSVKSLLEKRHVAAWLMSILQKGFKPRVQILEVVEASRWEEAERNWIGLYRAKGDDLCNHSDGGGGPTGHRPSDEVRKRMSEGQRKRYSDPAARMKQGEICRKILTNPETRGKIGESSRGRKHTTEARARMSEANREREISAETRAKLSKAHRGKKLTAETRAKLSESHLGKTHSAETRAKMVDSAHKRWADPEARKRLSESQIGSLKSPETRARMSAAKLGKKKSDETKEKMKVAAKMRWVKRREAAVDHR
jgi:group I intron endonuclease